MDGVEVARPRVGRELWQRLHGADVLCAPSLGGESFGMVLTEAFAAGTPVVASDIAGYRQVVTHGRDGVLVPHGRPLELAEALRSLWLDPAPAPGDGRRRPQPRRATSPGRASPQRSRASTSSAIAAPKPASGRERATRQPGLRPADLSPRRPARRLPSLEPAPVLEAHPARQGLRAPRRGGAGHVGRARACCSRSSRFGASAAENVSSTLVRSSPSWVLVALALFSTSMILRAVSWYQIVSAALPDRPVKRRTILSGTVIGVLMSATLPARLGEPSRALIVARRLGRMRETVPVLVGTLVSQTLLNLLALLLLGVIVLGTSDVLRGREEAVVLVGLVPVGLAAAVLIVPSLLARRSLRRVEGAARAAGARGRRRAAATAQGPVVFRDGRAARCGRSPPSSRPGRCSCSARSR